MMICAAFALPKTLVFSEGMRTTHDESGMIQKSLQRTGSEWKKHIQRILNKVYQDLYDNEDLAWMYAHFFSQELQSGSKLAKKFVSSYNKTKDAADKPLSTATALGGDTWEMIEKGSKLVKNARLIPSTENRLPALVGTAPGKIKLDGSDDSWRQVSFDEQILMLNKALGIANPWGEGSGQLSDEWMDDSEFARVSLELLKLIGDRARQSRVSISYINFPNTTKEELFADFAMGVVPWSYYLQVARGLSNIPPSLKTDGGWTMKDPWAQEVKLSLVRQHYSKSLAKLGLVGEIMFPPVKMQKPKKDGEGGGDKTSTSSSGKRKSDSGGGDSNKKAKLEITLAEKK